MSNEVIILAVLPSILYALAGVITARNEGKAVNYTMFVKTIVLGLISAGAISQTSADVVLAFTASGTFTYLMDKLVNSLARSRNKFL